MSQVRILEQEKCIRTFIIILFMLIHFSIDAQTLSDSSSADRCISVVYSRNDSTLKIEPQVEFYLESSPHHSFIRSFPKAGKVHISQDCKSCIVAYPEYTDSDLLFKGSVLEMYNIYGNLTKKFNIPGYAMNITFINEKRVAIFEVEAPPQEATDQTLNFYFYLDSLTPLNKNSFEIGRGFWGKYFLNERFVLIALAVDYPVNRGTYFLYSYDSNYLLVNKIMIQGFYVEMNTPPQVDNEQNQFTIEVRDVSLWESKFYLTYDINLNLVKITAE